MRCTTRRWQIPGSDTGQSTDNGTKEEERREGLSRAGGGGRMHHVSKRGVFAQSFVLVFGVSIPWGKCSVLSLLLSFPRRG